MTIALKKNKKTTTITLPTDLGAVWATPLKNKLCEAIDLKQPIIIDSSALTHCHSLCLQLLIAAERAATQQQLTLTYKKVPTFLPEAALMLGLNLQFTPAA
jgi:anti-anti-sigma regulatory factor